jgi:phage terminase large subunit-like protein
VGSHGLGELNLAALDALPADQREQAMWAIDRLQRGAKVNPLWGYVPHAKQRTYHEIGSMIGAFVGGNRSGKSYAGTADDIIQVVDADALPPHLAGFKRWDGECHRRVGTPNLRTTLKKTVLPLFKRLLPKDQLWKGSWDRAFNGEDRVLTLANGNTVDFLTYEMDVDAWAGAELHGIRFDEEPKGFKGRTIFEESIMRLLSTRGEFRMTFTPLLGLSWSYYELTVAGRFR